MTLLPSESWAVTLVDIPRYRVGPHCCVPGCEKLADHAHHLWRRSFINKSVPASVKGRNRREGADWVRVGGVIYGNLVGICYPHHQAVTENKAWIRLVDDFDGFSFTWNTLAPDGWLAHGPLEPQPPVSGALTSTPSSAQVGSPERTADRGEELPCPTCGHTRRPRPKVDLPPGERRPRVSWTISVPKDERENGADVLDALLAEAAVILGRDEHQSWKYFTAVEALAAFVQHGHLMVSNQ